LVVNAVAEGNRRATMSGAASGATAVFGPCEAAVETVDVTTGAAADATADETADETTNELARAVIGAAMEVHRELGPGYQESVYEKALCVELGLRGIPFESRCAASASYKGRGVGPGGDLVVGGRLVVELRTDEDELPVHIGQVISRLEATGCRPELVLDFNVPAMSEGIRGVAL
jgi:GxxExxY protein